MMRIDFDPAKDKANLAKHGITLAAAREFFESPTISEVDSRVDYGERRVIAYGVIAFRVYCCVYTDRGDVRRVISLRKANHDETETYFEGIGSR
ncbi:MAG: BrnT family toxin [Rhodospirillaceae bacterium]|nr:BrnT family toxin [Rhodospirillaceae bacterium]